jgi:hypothetical protein
MTKLQKLQAKLEVMAETGDPQIAQLANILLDYFSTNETHIGFNNDNNSDNRQLCVRPNRSRKQRDPLPLEP